MLHHVCHLHSSTLSMNNNDRYYILEMADKVLQREAPALATIFYMHQYTLPMYFLSHALIFQTYQSTFCCVLKKTAVLAGMQV